MRDLSKPPGNAGALLAATAVIECAVGVPLVAVPSWVATLLLGTPLTGAAGLLVARIAGAALLAIGVSCWLERRRPAATALSGLVGGLLVYNAAVFALLSYAALLEGLRGIGTWPACAVHLVMAIWCARLLRTDRRRARA
jgi:hypothetical protein